MIVSIQFWPGVGVDFTNRPSLAKPMLSAICGECGKRASTVMLWFSSVMITPRSIRFSNSRMLPGQS
ncbi:hypothetical protein D3C85_1924070 [compost metagenome]